MGIDVISAKNILTPISFSEIIN